MAGIDDLPPELLSCLLSYLPGPELASLCRVCKRFRDAIGVDYVWQIRCRREFQFVCKDSWEPATFYDLYTKVLHRWGKVVGLWQAHIEPYGGLTYVKYESGSIIGYDCLMPREPDVKGALRLKPLFTLSLHPVTGQLEQTCHKGYKGPHSCNILVQANPLEGLSLEIACPDDHKHPKGQEVALEEWILGETDGGHHGPMFHERELMIIKFHILMQLQELQHPSLMTPIKVPCVQPLRALVEPGLYKGNYGSHGIELVLLTYQEHGREAHGMKVTGDPNVPAREISIIADLKRPMILTEEQQDSLETLGEIDTPDLPPGEEENLREQPFRIPSDCIDRYRNNPKTCRARFHGSGRIAGHGYTNPSLVSGHWIVFDDHTFGFIWLDLRSFSMFSKVSDSFSIQPGVVKV